MNLFGIIGRKLLITRKNIGGNESKMQSEDKCPCQKLAGNPRPQGLFCPADQHCSPLVGVDSPLINAVPIPSFGADVLLLPLCHLHRTRVCSPRRPDTFRLRGAVMRVFDAREPEIEVWSVSAVRFMLLHPAVVIWDTNLRIT